MEFSSPPRSGKGASAPAARIGILVLGMHRSGTSALTRVLNLLGAKLPQDLMSPAENSNPTGFFESAKLRELHDRMLVEAASRWDDWRAFDPSVLGPDQLAFYKQEILRLLQEEYGDAPLLVLKDPRICRFVPLYEELLAEQGIGPFFILPLRNPLAVIASLNKRDGMTEGFAGLLWLRHVLDAEKGTRGKRRAFLAYEDLLGNWRGTIDRVTSGVEIVWPRGFDEAAAEIDAYLSRDLQHHRPTFADLEANGQIPAWIKESYAALQALTRTGGEGKGAVATLTRVRREFQAAAPVFGRATFPELAAREGKLKAGVRRVTGELGQRDGQIEELTAEKEALEAEQERVAGELGQRDGRIEELTTEKEALEAERQRVTGELGQRDGRIEELTAEKEALEAEQRRIGGKLGQWDGQIEVLTAQIAALETDVGALREVLAATGAKLTASETAVSELSNQITAIYLSRSWRLTIPLRAALRGLRAIKQMTAGRRGFGTGQGRRQTAPHQRKESQERPGSTDWLPGVDVGSEHAATLHVTDDHIAPARAVVERANVGRFSIVMPTWNRRQFVGRAIESVLAQSYEDWELIVCDDGSTDETEEYVREGFEPYLASGQIRYLKLEHRGVSAARNAGLRAAHGRWIAYLDSDNVWHPHYLLMTAAGYARARHRRTAYACVHVRDAAHRREFIRSQSFDWSRLLSRNFIDLNVFSHHWDLYEQLGGFDESLTRLVDWDLILRYTQLYEPQFNPFVLCDYYISYQLDNITLRESLEANETAVRRKFATASARDDTPSLRPADAKSLMRLLTEVERSVAAEKLRDRSQDVLVSVVMATWNRGDQVADAIRSVQTQSYENWELLIVDDGSTDATSEIVERLSSEDERVRYLPVAHGGVSAARDAGLEAARGELIAYLDSDNRWDPDYLLFMVNAVLDSGRMCAYAALRVIDYDQERAITFRRRRFDYGALLKNNYIDINVFVHRAELFHELGGFDHELRRWVDWDLILRYVRKYPPEEVPVVLCDYKQEERSHQITLKEPSTYKLKVLNKHLIDWEAQRRELQRRKPGLVSVVIPNFDLPETTETCVKTILAAGGPELEVIVVENGSAPPNSRKLRARLTRYEKVRLLENYENYGFALGCNLGAAASHGEFVIWLNNDTEVTRGWIESLVQPLQEDPTVGIVGPRLLWPDGTLQHGGMVFGPRSKIPYHIYQGLPADHPAVNKRRLFQALSGACLAVRASDFVKLEGFDPIFRNGCEDIDFCLRMRTVLNKQILYSPASVVIHHEGKTAGRSKNIQFNRTMLVSRWGDRIEVDDQSYYDEDGFVVKGYVKKGAERDGETALYHPELAPGAVEPDRQKPDDERTTLRVGFVSIWYERGVSYQTRQLALALEQNKGFETHVLARWESERFRNAGSIFHSRVVNGGDDPTPRETVEWARDRRLDVVVFVEIHPNDWKRVEALKGAGFRVLCYDNLDILRMDMLDRYEQVDGFLANSFFGWKVWQKEFPSKPALVIPWGIPPDLVRGNLTRKSSPLLRFVHIAGWGGLENRKNTGLSIEAFHEAAPPEARLSVFTQSPVEKYGEACIDIAQRDPAIEVHVGTLDNIWEIYQDADVLLWPSKREGLGLPIVEALASGLPALISDGWLMKEWPILGEHAVLCRARAGEEAAREAVPRYLPLLEVDRDDLVRRIRELASSRAEVAAMTAAVRRDRSRWLWTWQAVTLGTELKKFVAEGGFHPDPASYIPANMLEFERRRAASRGEGVRGTVPETEADPATAPTRNGDGAGGPGARFLFIAGCQRSGTTALLQLLNQDDRFVIGRERFKHCRSAITPDHFREEHFFFPDKRETNYRVKEFYDELRVRWNSGAVCYIGDKVPFYYKDLFYLAATFPDCKILFLVRDLEGVAASYNARAENPEDKVWKPSMDYRQAAEDWNESLARLDEFVRAGRADRIFLIQYERFFSGEESYLEALYEFLGLPMTAEVLEAFRTMTRDWETRSSHPSPLAPDMIDHLAARRDHRLERRCLSLTANMGEQAAMTEGH